MSHYNERLRRKADIEQRREAALDAMKDVQVRPMGDKDRAEALQVLQAELLRLAEAEIGLATTPPSTLPEA